MSFANSKFLCFPFKPLTTSRKNQLITTSTNFVSQSLHARFLGLVRNPLNRRPTELSLRSCSVSRRAEPPACFAISFKPSCVMFVSDPNKATAASQGAQRGTTQNQLAQKPRVIRVTVSLGHANARRKLMSRKCRFEDVKGRDRVWLSPHRDP